MDGGPGVDGVSYDTSCNAPGRDGPERVTLAGGADDGLPGEHDDIRNVETVTTGPGDDTIVGTDAAEYIVAEGGDDVIAAGGGNDTIAPGAAGQCGWPPTPQPDGRDIVDAGPGNDLIDLENAATGPATHLEDTLACGDGYDTVAAEFPLIELPADCERLCHYSGCTQAPVVAEMPPVAARLSARRRVLTLALSCPAGTKGVCAGRVSARHGQRPVVSTRGFRVKAGRSRRLALRLSKHVQPGSIGPRVLVTVRASGHRARTRALRASG